MRSPPGALFVIVASISLAVGSPARAAEPLAGRVVSISLGTSVSGTSGSATARPPALLAVPPELQLSWGLRLGRHALLLTRVDLLGCMLPLGPSGVGVELGVAWTGDLARDGWTPVARAGGGVLALGSGGELLGPDYSAYGFRLAAEAGALWTTRPETVVLGWGLIAGGQAVGLVHVEPCRSGDDCSEARLGASLRVEALSIF